MEFHRVTRAALADPRAKDEAVDQTVHIFSTARLDDADTSPLQFVSAALLAYYQRCEAELAALKASMAANPDTTKPTG